MGFFSAAPSTYVLVKSYNSTSNSAPNNSPYRCLRCCSSFVLCGSIRSRQRYRRVSLILPSSISNRSSNAVEGYQRCSIANSLPGAHSRLIASTAATRDNLTSATSSSIAGSKKPSSPRCFHNSHPRKQLPNCRVLSSRTRLTSTRATCGSSSGTSIWEGNSFSCSASPCSLNTSTLFSHRACAEPFNSPK